MGAYLDRFDPHDTVAFFYDDRVNRFIEPEYGTIVNDITNYVTANQIFVFKHYAEDMIFPDVTGQFLVELVHPASQLYFEEDEAYYKIIDELRIYMEGE